MLTDPIADMITRIRNAVKAEHRHVEIPGSRVKKEITKILFEEGYIGNYTFEDDNKQGKILITLKYINDESPIHEIKRISKPSRRVYVGKKDIPLVTRGFGISLLSTPKGIMSDAEARKNGVGGELLLEVW
ncbi:30S ribosomal protein S8 [candidate division WOR-3 bacterium]|nr:30S ribosomal protein S8 [candidate division WOR-3 bacterium]MCK4526813.1 30S ribosomal protein S8 [candidate division WOR-3 bacterium]